ncbi:hypothetical protein MKW92_036925, partial [Papaver armeniacum]
MLLPLKIENLQFAGYAKSGQCLYSSALFVVFFFFGRTVASLEAVILRAFVAARQSPIHMAGSSSNMLPSVVGSISLESWQMLLLHLL